MNDQFIALDKLLLELVFQLEQDSNAKEEAKQQITLLSENIREKKRNIFILQDKINTIDDEIAHYSKHIKYMKNEYTNWMLTRDILHKHEVYLQDQLRNHQETTEKDKKMYQDYVRQYKEILKQYQQKYSETPLAQEYYKNKAEVEEIKKRILTCTEQCKIKETILMELLAPAPFKSLTQWTLQIVQLRSKTEDILKYASTLIHKSCKLKEETDEIERKINFLNQQTARISETKNLSEILEEKSEKLEKMKEFKERIFEEHGHFRVLNENLQNSQPFLPYTSQNLVRPVRNERHFSEPRETDEKEESSSSHSTLARIDFRPERKAIPEFDDSVMNKYSKVSALKSTQNLMQFRFLLLEKQSNYKQIFDKGSADSECGEKETERELKDSADIPQDSHTEHMGKLTEDNHDETEENTEKFPSTPEMPLFLRTPEFLKTPECVEKLEFSKSPSSELLRNLGLEAKSQKTPHAFSFDMGSSTSPGFNLFESSEFGNENLPDQFDENYSSGNLNPVSSQKDIGGLFGKSEGEDTFTFPFSSEPSTHTFGDGKDDFSFSFSFEQEQHSSQSSSSISFPSSQNSKQFTFF
ncbi:protein SIX6OS1 [Phascolarctos cinereus]|uniref:Protein SIX6OS1 n=1 Tax=Phascolarctos cinereus TaxID=38626 RepID=A0A6P5KB12_PHACI|nr:protein SIX6OS1 [Phascolarctos cinereus]